MHDENIFKMSELADTEIKDIPTINILLCYLLYKIDRPVGTEYLYEIAISTGVINYFSYCAKELKKYAPKSYRDKLVLAALRYFTKLKYEQELKIEYIPIENGYYTHIRCLDTKNDLMDLKLYAPDLTQAKLIGEKIRLNPSGFYGKVIELALSNEEAPYDLSDN